MVHGHLLQVYSGTELVGFAESAVRRARAAGQPGPPRARVHGVPELLAAAQPEAVFICTPTHTHLAVTRECLVRPVHLFMEKPVATSVADADAILALAREHRVMHAAGYVYAHLPIVEEARRLLGRACWARSCASARTRTSARCSAQSRGGSSSASSPAAAFVANMARNVCSSWDGCSAHPPCHATTHSHASAVEDSAHALLWFDAAVTVICSIRRGACRRADAGLRITIDAGRDAGARSRADPAAPAASMATTGGWSEIHASDLPADTRSTSAAHRGEPSIANCACSETACRTGSFVLLAGRAGNAQRMIEASMRRRPAGNRSSD